MALQFPKAYIVSQIIAPSTLTADTIYFSIKNVGNVNIGTTVHLKKFDVTMLFAGTSDTTSSAFALQRVTGTPTGGSVITPTKTVNVSYAMNVECRFSNSGLGGVTPPATDRFNVFGIPSQAGAIASAQTMTFEDENLFDFTPGESLLVIANSAIVSGARAALRFHFYESP